MTSLIVIDGVKSNRQILGKIIETIDPTIVVHNFDCAEAALHWISKKTPDLVITDYKMPGLDGIEFTKRLWSQSKPRSIPVLMITIADDLNLPIVAREAGVAAFFRRPVDYQLVRTRITSLLVPRNKQKCLKLVVDNSSSHGAIC